MKKTRKKLFLTECVIFFAVGSFFTLTVSAGATGNSCVDCHSKREFITTNKKLYTYYQRWEKSVHAHEGVTCIDCHAGDPAKVDKKSAHGLDRKGDNVTLSAVYYSRIPDVCGKCHHAIVANYKKSKHYQYLTKDDLLEMRGANCVTCHDMGMSVADGNNLMPKAIASCKICHNYKTRNYPDIPARIQVVLQRYAEAKRIYSNLITQHQNDNKLPQQIKRRYANSLVSLVDNLHALRLDKVETDSSRLLAAMKDVRKKLRKGIAVKCD